jgi:hypothetical protein
VVLAVLVALQVVHLAALLEEHLVAHPAAVAWRPV